MSQKAEVVLTLKDNFSETLKKTKELQEKFTKDLDGMQKRLDAINKTKATIKIEADQAKRELDNAKKAYEEFNDELHKDALVEAQHRFDNFSDSLKETSKQARDVKRAMEELAGVQSKLSNHADSSSGGSGGTSGSGSESGSTFTAVAGGIITSQLFGQLKDSVASYAGQYITSAYGQAAGDTAANLASGIVGGLAGGTALGAQFGGGYGAIIGAIAGLITGVVSGLIKDSAQKGADKDTLFQSTVKDIYDEVVQMRQTMLSEGSVVAAQRETNLTAFATLLRGEAWHEGEITSILDPRATGDAGLRRMMLTEGRIADDPKAYAQEFLDSIIEFSRSTPFGYEDLTSISKTLLTYGYQSSQILPMLTKIGDAGAALGWDSSSKVSVATYLGRMAMSDRVTMQYLNPLIAQGLDVISYIRESLEPALGEITNADVMDMVSRGELSGKAVSDVILAYMGEDFKGSMDELQHSYDGLQSTLEDWDAEMEAAMGRGFNEKRKGQMEKQIQWYEDNADELAAMYEKVGEYEAGLIGDKEAAMRDSFDALLDEFKNGSASPGEMSQELYDAIIDAKVEYFDSEGYQSLYDSQLEIVNRIQADLREAEYDCGYALGQAFSKGYAEGLKDTLTEISNEKYGGVFNNDFDIPGTDDWSNNSLLGMLWRKMTGKWPSGTGGNEFETSSGGSGRGIGGKYAYGLDSVPYDNYPALLHAGERVLTAAQARAADHNAGSNVMITGNTFVVRQESDIEAIATALYVKLEEASVAYVGG